MHAHSAYACWMFAIWIHSLLSKISLTLDWAKAFTGSCSFAWLPLSIYHLCGFTLYVHHIVHLCYGGRKFNCYFWWQKNDRQPLGLVFFLKSSGNVLYVAPCWEFTKNHNEKHAIGLGVVICQNIFKVNWGGILTITWNEEKKCIWYGHPDQIAFSLYGKFDYLKF